ncbi:hypothetical protein FRC01_013712, partial [Tulasnella sp. 417]
TQSDLQPKLCKLLVGFVAGLRLPQHPQASASKPTSVRKRIHPFALGHPTGTLDVQVLLEAISGFNAAANAVDGVATAAVTVREAATSTPASRIESPAYHLGISGDTHAPRPGLATEKAVLSLSGGATSGDKITVQAKRARERAKKKQKVDSSRGKDASRRVEFIVRSLEVAHEDFALNRTVHSKQGYVGVPDKGQEWRNFSSSGRARIDYLRDVGGYQLVDTTVDPRVDYPFVDTAGRVWAVALAEPLGEETFAHINPDSPMEWVE